VLKVRGVTTTTPTNAGLCKEDKRVIIAGKRKSMIVAVVVLRDSTFLDLVPSRITVVPPLVRVAFVASKNFNESSDR